MIYGPIFYKENFHSQFLREKIEISTKYFCSVQLQTLFYYVHVENMGILCKGRDQCLPCSYPKCRVHDFCNRIISLTFFVLTVLAPSSHQILGTGEFVGGKRGPIKRLNWPQRKISSSRTFCPSLNEIPENQCRYSAQDEKRGSTSFLP